MVPLGFVSGSNLQITPNPLSDLYLFKSAPLWNNTPNAIICAFPLYCDFDQKKYDLTSAGRYKLGKKLNVVDRIEHHKLAENLYKADGSLLYKAGTLIEKAERNIIKEELAKGSHIKAFPFRHSFSHPTIVEVSTKDKLALKGRVLANDIDLSDKTFFIGTVLTDADICTGELNSLTIDANNEEIRINKPATIIVIL